MKSAVRPRQLRRGLPILKDAAAAVVPFMVVIAVLASAGPALAGAITTWTGGGGNGNWSTSGNWNPSGNAPSAAGTYSLVFSGTTQISTTNSFSPMTIDSLSFLNSGSLGQATNVFTISGSTLNLVGATITTAAATNNAAFDGETINANVSLSGSNVVTIGLNHPISIAGNISGTGVNSITYGGGGSVVSYVYLSGSNSYTGDTFITGGNVQAGGRTSGLSNNDAFGSGLVTVSGSGQLVVRYNSTVRNNLVVSGAGGTGNAVVGSFATAGSTATLSGTVTLAGDAAIGTASSATGDQTSKLLISGPVNLGSNTLTFRPGKQSAAAAGLLIDVTGQIAGSGGVVLNAPSSVGPLKLSGSNSYTGSTTITSGTLIANNANALGNGAALIVNTNGLDLNGLSVNAGALSGSSSGVIRSNVAGAARLITTATTDSVYAGSILNGQGAVGLTKAGSGVLSLTGSNNYSGSTAVNGGVLALDGANAIVGGGDVTFGGGTLRYSASNTTDFSSQFKNSSGAIAIDTNGQTVTFASQIVSTNVSGLTKSGSGTLYLNAANQYSGPTTVGAGTLAGTGSVLGLLSVGSGAVFDPGSGPSATSIFGVGSFSQAAGGTTNMQVTGLTAGTTYDQVLFSGGSKTVSWGGILNLVLTGSYANQTVFNLFSGFTSQSGHLSLINLDATGSPYAGLTFAGPSAGVWYTRDTSSGQYLTFNEGTGDLTVVPEPSGFAIIGLGIASACWWTRRTRGRRRVQSGMPR